MNPPPPPPAAWNPPDDQQQRTDEDHLNLLSIFHLVWGLLGVLGLLGLWAHYHFMNTIWRIIPGQWQTTFDEAPVTPLPVEPSFPVDAVSGFFYFIYAAAAVFFVLDIVLNLMAWRHIKARRARTLTFVTAGFNCLAMPLGTVLGIFTFIVLLRPSVKRLYDTTGCQPGLP
jgi:hypothetical protein